MRSPSAASANVESASSARSKSFAAPTTSTRRIFVWPSRYARSAGSDVLVRLARPARAFRRRLGEQSGGESVHQPREAVGRTLDAQLRDRVAARGAEQRRREHDPIRRPDDVAEQETSRAEAARERERRHRAAAPTIRFRRPFATRRAIAAGRSRAARPRRSASPRAGRASLRAGSAARGRPSRRETERPRPCRDWGRVPRVRNRSQHRPAASSHGNHDGRDDRRRTTCVTPPVAAVSAGGARQSPERSTRSSARTISSAVCGRSAGFFARHFITSAASAGGTSGARVSRGAG